MSIAKVPLLDVGAQNQPLKQEILETVSRLLDSSSFILGSEVHSLEEEICAYTGIPHSIACASGSDALLLPLMCENIGPGDEVLVPAFTFYATAGAVARLGATPVFVDSDDTYNISLEDLAKKITPRTKAVIPVHIFGQMVDMEALDSVIKKSGRKIAVIEDCAQSIGASFKGKQCGTWGQYGAFSFYPTKNLGAIGDAGLVSTLTEADAQKVRMVRVHGSKQRYFHEMVGVNSRLDSLQAAVLRIKLRHLGEYEKKREAIATSYLQQFQAARLEEVRLPVVGPNRKHVWNQFTIRAKRRDELKTFLAEQGIGSEIYYPLAMHRQEAFKPFLDGPCVLPVCEALEKEVLSLPIYPEMPVAHVQRVVEQVVKFYRK
ncbi:MAG: DegT/DnrJ/EryC1/StrS family aminotransferase [Bdellovibrionota bacterium]